jgi:hypothetical protein
MPEITASQISDSLCRPPSAHGSCKPPDPVRVQHPKYQHGHALVSDIKRHFAPAGIQPFSSSARKACLAVTGANLAESLG